MLSETLTTALEAYAVGPKVRRLRLHKKLGLVQLGEHTGLSPALLSKIERGQLFPTLPTLLRIALVFGVGLDHFFKDSERPVHTVVRKGERIRLPDKAGRHSPAYYFESLDFPVSERKLNGYYVEIEAEDEPSEPHEHPGAEIFTCCTASRGEIKRARISRSSQSCRRSNLTKTGCFSCAVWPTKSAVTATATCAA